MIVPTVATCTSSAVSEPDHFCHYNMRGPFTDGPFLGTGHIGGRVVTDDRNYGPNAAYGENCYSQPTGVVKFINDLGWMRAKIDRANSYVCDGASGTRDVHLVLLPTPGGNIGPYTVVTGGVINWEAVWKPTGATTYKESVTFDGSVTTT